LVVIQSENEMPGRMFGTEIDGEVAEKWGKYEDLNIL